MMEAVYDPNSFNNLPLIGQAAARFNDISGDHVVSTTFEDLFVCHKMDRTFGLALLHRHFELDANERLVEYRGTSVPWAVNDLAAHIKPSSWLISATGTVHPYEFYHSLSDEGPTLDLGNPHQQAFLTEFAEVLSQHNAQGLFGLCRYPGDDFKGRVEITQGRSNINLTPEDYPKNLDDHTSNAAWFFSPPLVNFKCICPCLYAGGGHSGNHGGYRDVT